MHSSITGLFIENPAQEKLWKHSIDNEDSISNRTEFNSIIEESIEYFCLKLLSYSLGERFNSERGDHMVAKLGRKDLPQILLENRFLELFSRMMKDRPAFMDHQPPTEGEVVIAYGKNGEIYSRFELFLPIESIVSKTADGSILISNSRFDLSISAHCSGFNTNTPFLFEQLYLGMHLDETSAHSCELKISVKYKLRSLLSGASWKNYAWIDNFIDRTERGFSFEEFSNHIGWDQAVTRSQLKRPPPREPRDPSAMTGVQVTKLSKADQPVRS